MSIGWKGQHCSLTLARATKGVWSTSVRSRYPTQRSIDLHFWDSTPSVAVTRPAHSRVYKGHVGPIKLIKKFPRFMKPLAQIGNQWNVPTSLVDELEELTCAIYGQQNFSSVDEVRLHKFKKKHETRSTDSSRNVKLALLPPCKILFNILRG